MSGDLTQGANTNRESKQKTDLSASLPNRAAPGTMIRVDETPEYSLRSWQGKECPVNLDRPFISLTSDGSSEYSRGKLVYPIADEGKTPGAHDSEGWITVSSLNVSSANFCGKELEKGVVELKKLLEISGNHTGISAQLEGTEVQFFLKGQQIDQADATETLLSHYALMRLPENIRSSGIASKVGEQKETKHETGIICDSLEEVAYLLKGYNDGSIRSSRATEDRLFKDVGESQGGLAVGFLALAMNSVKSGKASLVDRLIAEVNETVGQQHRKLHKSYDYDGMGSAFFKTSVDVEPVGDKFIIGINAANVGDKPEKELAKAAGKELALSSIGARFPLTQISQNLVGVDLNRALDGSDFNAELIAKSAAGEMDRYKGDKATVEGKHGTYVVGVWLGQEDNYGADIFRARGSNLYMNLEEGKGDPFVALSVKLAQDYAVAVTGEQKAEMAQIRDKVASLIQQAHS